MPDCVRCGHAYHAHLPFAGHPCNRRKCPCAGYLAQWPDEEVAEETVTPGPETTMDYEWPLQDDELRETWNDIGRGARAMIRDMWPALGKRIDRLTGWE